MATAALRCTHCGYDVSATLADGFSACPECGTSPCDSRLPLSRLSTTMRVFLLALGAIPIALVPVVTWFASLWLTDQGYNPIGVRPSWLQVPMLAEALVPWAWVAYSVFLFLLWVIIERRRRPMHARRRAAVGAMISVLAALSASGELVGAPWVRDLAHEALRLAWCPECQ